MKPTVRSYVSRQKRNSLGYISLPILHLGLTIPTAYLGDYSYRSGVAVSGNAMFFKIALVVFLCAIKLTSR